MFKYNETSFTGQFIQNLLRNSPVPIMPILTDTQYVNLKKDDTFPEKGDIFSYIYGRNFYKGSNLLGPYEFGKKYPNTTDNYIPLQSYYSTELHEHLGNYLRNYSEYYKINLMGLYNCFSNRLVSSISLPLSDGNPNNKDVWYTSPGIRNDCTITCFPIQVDGSYTIKIYGSVRGDILIQPIFYNGSTFVKIGGDNRAGAVIFPTSTYGYSNTITYTFNEDVYKKLLNDPGGKPVSISYARLLQNQKYLYLFIQVPVVENLRISVIENSEFFNVVNNSLLNLSNISYNVPFSDRLLEFLVGNVITREDPIKQNITRIQNLINIINPTANTANKEDYKQFTKYSSAPDEGGKLLPIPPYNNIISTNKGYAPIPGLYDGDLRIILYDYLSNGVQDASDNYKGIPDFTGYVDKDVEQILTRQAKARTLYSKGNYPFQKSNRR